MYVNTVIFHSYVSHYQRVYIPFPLNKLHDPAKALLLAAQCLSFPARAPQSFFFCCVARGPRCFQGAKENDQLGISPDFTYFHGTYPLVMSK